MSEVLERGDVVFFYRPRVGVIELDPEAERLDAADLFEARHVSPEGLAAEPVRSGRLR